jgi:hypothetical protein
MPLWMYWKINQIRKSKYITADIIKKFEGISNYKTKVEELNLPINIGLIAENPFLAPLIIELGFFINKFENKLNVI